MPVNWLGNQVSARMKAAQKAGVNRTMGECVVTAKSTHAWQNRSGVLEGSIDIHDYAHETQTGVRGVWGSRDVRYALIHELGGTIKPKRARALFIQDHAGEISAVVASVTIPARPYLRPSADANYPSLVKHIREAFAAASRGARRSRTATANLQPLFGTGGGAPK